MDKDTIPAVIVLIGLLYAGYKIGGLSAELLKLNETTSSGVLGVLTRR